MKKAVCILLTLAVILTCCAVGISARCTISDELQQQMNAISDDETIRVNIWVNSITMDESELHQQAMTNAGFQIWEFDKLTSAQMSRYILERRKIESSLEEQACETFIKKFGLDEGNVHYTIATCINADLTKEQIESAVTYAEVNAVYYDPLTELPTEAPSETSTDTWTQKIDAQIIDRLEKPGDTVGSWMWFTEIDREECARRVAEATGYTEEEFAAKKKSMPQTTQEEKDALREFINSYIRTRTAIMSDMYEENNSKIIGELGITDVLFMSTLTNSAIVNLPKNRVYEIARSPYVISMYYYRLEAELPEPPEGVTYRCGDAFVRYVSERSTSANVPEIWSYEELYYHEDSSGETDWVLLDALCGNAVPWMGFGIVGNRVIMNGPLEIFEFGMGLYDVKNDSFLDLTDMTDLSAYSGLEEAIDLYGRGRLLGDLDGDDTITVIDATIIQRCEVKTSEYPESDVISTEEYIDSSFRPLTYYSDFNRDGERDVTDATCIQRYLVGASYPKYR